MKHKRLAAAVLAAALWLTGCGGAAAPAAPAGSGAASQSAADTAVQTAQKDRITEQFTLEKTIQLYEWGSAQKLTIHVPQLVCDGPDAAYLNDELAAMYAADFRQYEDSPEIEPQQDEWSPEIYINWDAYWYGDCVSLVVFRYDGGTDPGYSGAGLRFCHRKAGLRDRNAAAHGAGPGRRAAADAARGHADL